MREKAVYCAEFRLFLHPFCSLLNAVFVENDDSEKILNSKNTDPWGAEKKVRTEGNSVANGPANSALVLLFCVLLTRENKI